MKRPSIDAKTNGPFDKDCDSERYRLLITDNLEYIEHQCRKACGVHLHQDITTDNCADELFIELIGHLEAFDFKRLREFEGRANIRTYLTVIISNLLVDLLRSKKGRGRERERAREFGETGERLYDLIIRRGYTTAEACEALKTSYSMDLSFNELAAMAEKIRGCLRSSQKAVAEDVPSGKMGPSTFLDEAGEIVIADNRYNPEDEIISRQRSSLAKNLLPELSGLLSGEDKLIFRMKFPLNDKELPKRNADIAKMVGLSEKAVEKRVTKILRKCRELILGKGLSLEDFVG
jgi:RNA polymerase sigma factor (sigma-70 family)